MTPDTVPTRTPTTTEDHPTRRSRVLDRPVSRRCALFGAGGVGAAAVLAACSSGSDGASSSSTGGGAGSSAAAPGSTAAGSPTAGSSSGSSGGAAIAQVADIPVGGAVSVQVAGENVLLSQPTAGAVEGFSAVCPHQGGQVFPDGGKFQCHLHFSEFSLDGTVTKGPATKDLTPFPVTVSGSDVVQG